MADDTRDAGPSKDASTSTSSASPTDTGSATAGSGPTLRGTGYTVTMPEGWTDQTSQESSGSDTLDRLAVNASTVMGSTANVAIAKSSSFSVSDPEDVRDGWEKGLKSTDPNATITDIADRRIDGEKAIGASISRNGGSNSELAQTAYLVIHNGTGYTVVFTYRDGDTDQDGVFDTFLAGWSWS